LSAARPDVDSRRLAWAIMASAATGAVIYWVVIRVGLPALRARLSTADVDRLREVFQSHPGWVIAALGLVPAILALPVLLVFRAVSGPFQRRGSQR
jgi:membrane protein DedA with SNARE-associated domain